jgi:D-alanyl-lipoteichoic acid acyltransferase DltB (MBOAT superfamily)
MLFSSPVFLGFMLVVLLVYPRLRLKGQNLFLLFASYIFYGYWDWRFVLLLVGITAVNFVVGQRLSVCGDEKRKKVLFILGIAVNLVVLGFFKYFNFFVESFVWMLNSIGFQPHVFILKVILPVGISFYTFQAMTYIFDIFRGKLQPTTSFLDFALFVGFFPQLLSGPIERAKNLLPQIASPRVMTISTTITGLNLVLLGYFKKIAIADTLAPIVDKTFSAPGSMSGGQLWTGVYAFAFQIYGDFSGYTDIARGIALILGFRVMENFNAPYLSRNVTEFWRRWHISLSTWLRDYLYIPLGGNRTGWIRTYVNLMIVMFICGLWHGAAWTFILWGIFHGIYLGIHRIMTGGKKVNVSWPLNIEKRVLSTVKVVFTFHLVAVTWVFFKASSISNAMEYLRGLARFDHLADLSFPVMFAGILMLGLDLAQVLMRNDAWLTDPGVSRTGRYAAAQFLMISILASAIGHLGQFTPFIYFQF